MTLSDLSIRRPVLTIVLAIIIVLIGGISYVTLGVREYPSVDPPVVTITTNYIGANADIIESQVTEPIEETVNSVEGIRTISSISTDGRSTISVTFYPEIDLNDAANDIRDKVSQAIRIIPPDAEPPIVSKADANSDAILSITVQSDRRTLPELTQIGDRVFKDRLQTIPGVSSIRIWGEKKYAMRLMLDVSRMAALGITTEELRTALYTQNIELPSGRIEGRESELTVRTIGRLNTPEEYDNMIIRSVGGKIIRLRDFGKARLGAEVERSILRGNGVIPMVGIALQPQPGANYIDIVDEAFRRVELIKKELPADIRLNVALDSTVPIRGAILEVTETIFAAFGLVVVIVFIFLRNWRTTLIPVVLIPISLIGTFAFLWAAGFSVNVLTLLGMVLATGLVVDDAIVVMENIYSKIEKGMSPVKAAFEGSREVYFAVIATSVSLACVFLPIFFIQGLTGQLFREFALVVLGAIIISTFISLTLTPMMSSRVLRPARRKISWLEAIGKSIDRMSASYSRSLHFFMRRRSIALIIVAASSTMIWWIAASIPSELAPLEDKSQLRIVSTAPEGTSFEAMDNYQEELMRRLDTLPEKAFLLGVTAPTFRSSTSVNSSFVRMTLVPPSERSRSQNEIANDLNRILREHSFARSFVIQEPTISSQGRFGGLPVQFVIQAPDIGKLREVIPAFMQKVRSHPAFSASDIDLVFNKPEFTVEINRDKAAQMGVSVEKIASTLRTLLSEERLGYFIYEGKQYYIIAEAGREFRNDPTDLANITVANTDNAMVPLGNLVTVSTISRPPSLLRFNRYTSATVSASPADGYTIARGIEVMNEIADEVLDESFRTELTGSASDYAESSGNLMWIFVLSLALVYLILAAQFESFRDPAIILLTVPLALAGALLTLWLFGQTLNIFSQIGMIVLIGIVTKNGILIVEFANQKKEEGLSLRDAAIEAAAQRFRPILMTSMSTVFGALPIALALGSGATSRIPMGLAIVGGLLFSLLLTLYVIPVMYTYLADKNRTTIREEDHEA
jgi:hydrophobe/amphiphile efflux-1 (HAE1) family protein